MRPRHPSPRTRRDPGVRGVENALRGLAVPGPDPDFEVRLRARLLAISAVQASTVTAPRARPISRRPRRWLPRAVAAGAAGVVGIAGIGVATSRAVPGQPLYVAKRQIESWQLSAASGQADRGREQLSFARTRLAEVEAMSRGQDLTAVVGTIAGGSTGDRIASTLRRMDAETRAGTSDLVFAARAGDGQATRELLTFANGQNAHLGDIASRLPASAASAVDASRAVLRQVAALALTLPGAPSAAAAHPTGHSTARPEGTSARATPAPSQSAASSPSPSPVATAPPRAVTGSPAVPSTLPTETAIPSPGPTTLPDPTVRPSGPPPRGVPTAISGLLRGGQRGAR